MLALALLPEAVGTSQLPPCCMDRRMGRREDTGENEDSCIGQATKFQFSGTSPFLAAAPSSGWHFSFPLSSATRNFCVNP